MSTINRRTIITGAAAAIPAAAIAAVPALEATEPDAELIALGREIEAFLPRYLEATLRSCFLGWDAHHILDEIVERIGEEEHTNEVMLNAHAEAEAQVGYPQWGDRYNEMLREETRLAEAVAALPARTDKGLRTKALMFVLQSLHSLTIPIGSDYKDDVERRLVEAFIETLGIPIPADLVPRIKSPIDCRDQLHTVADSGATS